MTTIDTLRSHLGLFNKDYIHTVDGKIDITEKKAGGKGTVTFDLAGEGLLLKARDNAPIVWCLDNRKCAEGGFVTFDADGVHLHLVELKSTLKPSNWADVLNQFEGMFLSALAVFGIFRITHLASVTCYIAYKTDKMSHGNTSSLILLKTPVGGSEQFGGQQVWQKERLQLPHATPATVKKIQRDAHGNAHFGRV